MDSDEGEASYVPGEATVKEFSQQQFGAVASPYVATYVFRKGNIDKDFVCVEMLMDHLELAMLWSK